MHHGRGRRDRASLRDRRRRGQFRRQLLGRELGRELLGRRRVFGSSTGPSRPGALPWAAEAFFFDAFFDTSFSDQRPSWATGAFLVADTFFLPADLAALVARDGLIALLPRASSMVSLESGRVGPWLPGEVCGGGVVGVMGHDDSTLLTAFLAVRSGRLLGRLGQPAALAWEPMPGPRRDFSLAVAARLFSRGHTGAGAV